MNSRETPYRTSVDLLRERKSLSQEVAEIIKEKIRDGQIVQGERIVESKLARELGLSLTPIREAVRELVGEGILTVSPNRGPSVRILTPEDAYELYSLRGLLEGLAIKLAIERSSASERESLRSILDEMERARDYPAVATLHEYSRRIHEGIVALSSHDRLISFYASLALQIALLNRIVAPTSSKEHEIEWHRPVIAALMSNDPEAAEMTMKQHIRESYEAYVRAFHIAREDDPDKIVFQDWI